jgi:penicillin-binding protein 2
MAGFALKDHLRETRLFVSRAVVAGVLIVLLMAALAVRLGYLQVTLYDHYRTLSSENRVKLVPLPPTRGLIYDRSGALLADNYPTYSLEITPDQVGNLEKTLEDLRHIVRITDDDLQRFHRARRQQQRFNSVPIRFKLDDEEVARFAVVRHRFPGIDIQARLLRRYPEGDKAVHVLGYVGRINQQEQEQIDAADYAGSTHIGKLGIERNYEAELHGEVGLQQVEVNALGRVIRVLETQAPVPGKNLRLHLDMGLQEAALEALGEETGAVVAIDPKTGGVLALVSKPGYDPNPFVEGISGGLYRHLRDDPEKPLYNRALRGLYPPGSTIKPFVAVAGLEMGVVTAGQNKFCPGFYQLPGQSHRYRDWKKGGHGVVDLNKAIVESCDVYFYDLAHDLGIDRLHKFLSGFSFGRKTGIDLTEELGGLLPSREWKERARRQPWYPGETLIAGIGQGYVLTTPLQLAAAAATLANGGRYVTPRVAAAIEAPDGSVSVPAPQPPAAQMPVRSRSSWQDVTQGMLDVVEGPRGTARRIRTDAYRIAGKTGTAQVFTVGQSEEYDEDKIDKKLRDHALFIAFAPVEDPRIAVAVLIEHGGHGGAVAAPIARRIMDVYLMGEQPP